MIATGTGTLLGNRDVNGVALFMLTGWLVAVVALGWVRHSRLAYLREAEQRAAGEERLRIARELHDVVGHHLSLINVQAGTSLHRFHRDPAQGEAALAAIKSSSREALRDLRATLGVLRQADEEAPTAPAPTLDGIGALIGSARSAGLTVHGRVTGDAEPPTEVGLAAYRIVQESLTNVSRHAAAARVTVSVERGPGALLVEVADDGRGAAAHPAGPGSGVDGMRERARALGGELTAGPRQGGGFLVRARLPYENGTGTR
ncbi:sensor histidine kinase [Actinomadura luteofluorescens]|uniref:sensor histidine kinase n=1 Tax=Actinomadura luteofluorescens TaxID=46163 RepID=UPI0036349298